MQLRVFTTLAVFVAGTMAQAATLADSLSELPQCAQSCVIGAVGSSGCAPTDSTCLCTTGNKAFMAAGTTCLLQKSSCNTEELQQVQAFAKSACAQVLGSSTAGDSVAAATSAASGSSSAAAASGSASATKASTASGSASGSSSASSSPAASTGGAMQIGASMLAVGAGAIAFVL